MTTPHQPDVLFAAVHAAEFPGQAILRLRPDLQSQPVAIMSGQSPRERVCAFNQHARKRGVVPGLSRLEVEELEGVHILTRSMDTELAAREVLLESISRFSPRIEETLSPNACSFVLDISGSERLFGQADKLANSLRNAIISGGFRVSISISANFDAARMKAEFSRGINVIPKHEEAASLATIPISSLLLNEEHGETFALWGIRTLGDVAQLPEEQLITRFGQQAYKWIQLSRGTNEHTFQPIEARFQLKEHIEFETHVEQMDSLLFIGANMINNLVTRASGRALSLANITVQMSLEKSIPYQRMIRPAIPSNDRKFILKLLQLEIAAHPPTAAVVSLTLSAEAGQQSKVQLGLFTPQAPEPSRLDVTLARLKALVGDDRVGSPVLKDSHRNGSFSINNFTITDHPDAPDWNAGARTALRRMRPPRPLHMQLHSQNPAIFRDGTDRYDVEVAYGPWHSSGSWWSVDKWDLEEWDVIATNTQGESIGCLIVRDNLKNQWLLDAFYD